MTSDWWGSDYLISFAGVDMPLPMGVTGLLHLDMAFPSDRAADIGLLLGVGFNF